MKRLRIVLGNSELNRLYNRETVLVRTPQGEEMEIVFSLTVKKDAGLFDLDDLFKGIKFGK